MAFDRQAEFRAQDRTIPNRRYRLGYLLDQRESEITYLMLPWLNISAALNAVRPKAKNPASIITSFV
jgi:hypothetical protein